MIENRSQQSLVSKIKGYLFLSVFIAPFVWANLIFAGDPHHEHGQKTNELRTSYLQPCDVSRANQATGEIRIDAAVKDASIVFSSIEEDTSFNTFTLQVLARAADLSQGQSMVSNHRYIYVRNQKTCSKKRYYMAAKGGIVYSFESLEDLEDGFYTERIGFYEGGGFVIDNEMFEVSVVFIKYQVDGNNPSYSDTPSDLFESGAQLFDHAEIYLKRKS